MAQMGKELKKRPQKLEADEFESLPLSALQNWGEFNEFENYEACDMMIEVCRHIKCLIYHKIKDVLTAQYDIQGN